MEILTDPLRAEATHRHAASILYRMAPTAALAEAGAEVTLLARTESEISSVAGEILAAGGKAVAEVLDLPALAMVATFSRRVNRSTSVSTMSALSRRLSSKHP